MLRPTTEDATTNKTTPLFFPLFFFSSSSSHNLLIISSPTTQLSVVMLSAVRSSSLHLTGRRAATLFSPRPLSFLKQGVADNELEQHLGPFPSVRLSGLPYKASLEDVTDFLSGLRPLDVIVPQNSRNGSLGVLFASVEEAENALERDKDLMGSRYIDVTPISREEYYRMALESVLVGKQRSVERGEDDIVGAAEGSIVMMQGIPFRASYHDISKFFSGFDVPPERVILEGGDDGRPSGNAYVRFSSTDEADAALQFDRKYMGRRYVTLNIVPTESAENCRRLR